MQCGLEVTKWPVCSELKFLYHEKIAGRQKNSLVYHLMSRYRTALAWNIFLEEKSVYYQFP